MRSGTTLTQLVEFSDGFPDGNVDWQLLDGTGTPVANGNVVPEAGSASAVVTVTSAQNVIEGGVLYSPRELNWSYLVGGISHAGRYRYRLEVFLPLGLSEEGVRRKLGLEAEELEDEAIDLVGSYSRFRTDVGAASLDPVTGHEALLACDAIEALAALALLPSLQVKLAQKESSGTNQYQRANIKWDSVREQLEAYLAQGYEAVNPNAAPTADYPALLVAVVRADPVTGEGG